MNNKHGLWTRRTQTLRWSGVLGAALAGWLAVLPASAGQGVTNLYDGLMGSTPNDQGWIYLTQPLFNPSATVSFSNQLTHVDTTAQVADRAGYFSSAPFFGAHPQLPRLNRQEGFGMHFDLRVDSETHVSDDRAGLSVIVISEDLKGLEISFWEDEVWIQADDPLFTHGQGATFDTTAALTRYELLVMGDLYRLFAAGDHDPLLEGALQDYSSFNAPPFDFPYKTPSFLFVGDDTSSASAEFDLQRIDVFEIPEPSTAVLWVLAWPIGSMLVTRGATRSSQTSGC